MRLVKILYLSSCLALLTIPVLADLIVPKGGFPDSHYESLWTQSPFSADSSASGSMGTDPYSSQYALVGIVKIDDTFYANIQDKRSGEKFTVTNAKPSHGFVLLAVNRGETSRDSYALLEKGTQRITLHIQPADNSTLSNPPLPPSVPPPSFNEPAPGLPSPVTIKPTSPTHPIISLTPAPSTAPTILLQPISPSKPGSIIQEPASPPNPVKPDNTPSSNLSDNTTQSKPKFRPTTIEQRE